MLARRTGRCQQPDAKMCSSNDLAEALKSVLDEKGDLAEVRVQLEEQVVSGEMRKPAMPAEVILANNLIRQYLEHVGLHKTSSVLCAESGLPGTPVPHHVLKSTLCSVQQSGDKPLLQCLIGNILQNDP